jgi:hypothetical protein
VLTTEKVAVLTPMLLEPLAFPNAERSVFFMATQLQGSFAAWRPALARDGALLGSLTRFFEQTVQGSTHGVRSRRATSARRQAR